MASIQQYPLKTVTIADTIIGTKLPTTATGKPTTATFNVGDIVTLASAGNAPFQSLTVTGTSGVATLAAGVLNIPDYATGGASDTTYLLSTDATGIVILNASAGANTTVKFTGTANEVETTITTGANGIVRLGLPDDVVITTSLTVGDTVGYAITANGRISQTGLGNSTFVGLDAGLNDDLSNNKNTAIGYQALKSNTTGNSNTSVGSDSLLNNTNGVSNTAVGRFALTSNIGGDYNTATGNFSLWNNTTGLRNTANGYAALSNNLDGANNTAAGFEALNQNTTGDSNVGVGREVLRSVIAGDYNTAIGSYAGSKYTGDINLLAATSSIFIGYETKALGEAQTNQIVIGNNATGNGSNTVTIGNSSITDNYFTGNVIAGGVTLSGGIVSSVVGGTFISIDNADPINPIINGANQAVIPYGLVPYGNITNDGIISEAAFAYNDATNILTLGTATVGENGFTSEGSVVLSDPGGVNKITTLDYQIMSIVDTSNARISMEVTASVPIVTLREGGFSTTVKNLVTPTQDNDIRLPNAAGTVATQEWVSLGFGAALTEHADNAAALVAGLVIGNFYRTVDVLKVVH